jgi:hypothetical protein
MVVAALAIAAALAPASAGRTDEGRRVVLETKRDRITLVHAALNFYECEQFGDIGPLRIHSHANARVDRKGRFALKTGERAEMVTLRGKLSRTRASGTLSVSGTIATGQECHSHTLRFSAHAR